MKPKKLFILDAYSLLYRSYYATKYLSTSDGSPTGALYGFLGMVYKIIDKFHPDMLITALDYPGKTFRHQSYALYKSTRKPTPDDLKHQLIRARELLSVFRIPAIEKEGFEADDIIGTIAKKASKDGVHTTIITGDLDALQLVDEHVCVLTNKKGVSDFLIYTPEKVFERYGFGPEFITDYKAFVGDASDAIPGIPGVGPKTASKWISNFGKVENILQDTSVLETKWKDKIEELKDQLVLSKSLATIETDMQIPFEYAPYKIGLEAKKDIIQYLNQLEFRTFQDRFEKIFTDYLVQPDNFSSVENLDLIVKSDIVDAKYTGELHTLTEALDWISQHDFVLYEEPAKKQLDLFDQFDMDKGATCWIAIDLEVKMVSKLLAVDIFRSKADQAILFNAKTWYKNVSSFEKHVLHDIYVAAALLQPHRANPQLEDIIRNYMEIEMPRSPENIAACMTVLPDILESSLKKENMWEIYLRIEIPLTPILAKMERYGIHVDKKSLEHLSVEFKKVLEGLSSEIHLLANEEFLISSPKQLGEVLFEKLKIPGGKKNKTGYATGAEVLQDLAPEYEICEKILSWREITKLQNTYADALGKVITKQNRIHTTFQQSGAATGRLSSTEPNLQNIPIRTEMGRQIRKAFCAPEGYKLVSCDYSQIELRLLAHMSKDRALLEAFNHHQDIHAATAALMFHQKQDEVTKEQRRLAKILNFSVLYGVTEFGLANQLGKGFGFNDAKHLIIEYYARFPSVKAFTESIVEDAKKYGYTETLLGRRRYFPDIHTSNRHRRLYVERQAINAPIQGSAADMAKLAVIHVDKILQGYDAHILLQVHDELILEIHEDQLSIVEKIKNVMEHVLSLDVPVVVDSSIGNDWGELQ